jgi:hypothetical protein
MANIRNAYTISTGKLLKSGRLKEQKEMEDNFSIHLYKIVYGAWR